MAAKTLAGKPSLADKCPRTDFRFAPASQKDYFDQGLSDGVMVTQRPLEALFMVRIHVGQPLDFADKIKTFHRYLTRK